MKLIQAGIGLFLLFLPTNGHSQVIMNVAVVKEMADYINSKDMITIDGVRRIHMRCIGRGAPTVVFTAGLGAWSATWAKVQPEVAKTTRTCAWDRAGFGLSDGNPTVRQTSDATTHDLERALAMAKIKGPYILVGHSAGSHEVLTFADRHLADIAGLVLVDPVRPHDMARETAAGPKAATADRAYLAAESQRLRDCAAGVEAGTVKTGAPSPPCFQYFPEIPHAVQAALAKLDADPGRLRTQASGFEEYEPNGERVVKDDRRFGDVPLIVLSAGNPGLWAEEAKSEHTALMADWSDSHKSLAALAIHGERRIVEGSGHLVQLEQPQSVITAIHDAIVASAVRKSRPRP